MIKVMTVMALPPTTTKHFMHNFSILIRYDCIKNLEATKSKEKIIQHYCQTLLSGFNFTKKSRNGFFCISFKYQTHSMHYTR